MPNHQKHRGKHPADADLFNSEQWSTLTQAVDDYAFLLERGYAEESSLKLVGDRYKLRKRQRLSVARVTCTAQQRVHREHNRVSPANLENAVAIDGYNLLISVESALAGGIILQGRDGAFRDLASVHSSYHNVQETQPALLCIGEALNDLGVERAVWYLDKPVSNSGRLAQRIRTLAIENGWNWQVEVVYNPDKTLATGEETVISSDSWVLDNCNHWFNMFQYLLDSNRIPWDVIVL